ncbi:killer cell lectin-like receptor subfamily B member 1B allele C [Heteronotia binoei]|uniref:killer cell lectin-like receptor subfamily B member 1B allele C n=1 Tax=Heteronotia binoei TaxID=13085 RepID=UPI00292D8FA1|nr:killer cell lectin-like receptor subfamily B member 1B allele C [Heteronotia binoei]
MEDEESSMALNFQSTARGQKKNNPSPPVQETLVKQPRRHQITARIGCAVMFLLIGALIAHRIWAFQMRQPMDATKKTNVSQEPTTNGTENDSGVKIFVSHLWQFLCQPHYTGLADNATCKLCPENWLLYEDKCYWISKEKGSWKKGKEDCTARSSRLLVLQKQEDTAFIQDINEDMQLLWIGLQATFAEQKWTWVDGSPLDDKLSEELGPVEINSCGMLNGNKIISEACSHVTTWVCETEALNINNDKM